MLRPTRSILQSPCFSSTGWSREDDARDARAIWISANLKDVRPVAVKTAQQQAELFAHRVRSHWVSLRTATVNQLRSMLYEFGVVAPKGRRKVVEWVAEHRAQLEEQIPPTLVRLLDQQLEVLRELDQRPAPWQPPWGRQGLEELTRVRLLSGGRARPHRHWRQGPHGQDHQARRRVPANPADSRRSQSGARGQSAAVDCPDAQTPAVQCGGHRGGSQARAHRLVAGRSRWLIRCAASLRATSGAGSHVKAKYRHQEEESCAALE
jgi:hypothetical protein